MKITIETTARVRVETAWQGWTTPEDITQWNNASDDWHTPTAQVDLREGGRFCSRMEAKDGSMGFDFEGTFTKVVPHELIEYTMDDNRTVTVQFIERDGAVTIRETFEAETQNDAEMQRQGWQAILDNFAKHVEAKQ